MAERSSSKLKLLYVLKVLLEESDENHPLSSTDIQSLLSLYDIHAERKGIYNDVKALTAYGHDIITLPGTDGGFYIGSRQFELAELRLLIDSIQTSHFITEKKSEVLIQKLLGLCNKYDAETLKKQISLHGRPKAENERILYTIDTIHNAITNDVMVSFKYEYVTADKKYELSREGKTYKISPWALVWMSDFYYMLGYDHEAEMIKYYRIDRMKFTKLTSTKREGAKAFDDYDLASFAKRTFNMRNGDVQTVTLKADKGLVAAIIDRFGMDTPIMNVTDETFTTHVEIAVSEQFFGWLSGLGSKISIVSPESVKQKYKAHLNDILDKM